VLILKNKLSLIIPCYNEELSIHALLERVLNVNLQNDIEKEIIVVDDGSTDNTFQAISNFKQKYPEAEVQIIRHEKNRGKGASIRSALPEITGDFILIQDADLEYDPIDYSKLLRPIVEGHADVVYGSRFRGSEAHRVLFFAHSSGNKFLTFCSNFLTGLNLTDMETGYKMFKTDILKGLRLKENRFGFEPEVTAKISKVKKIRIYEVGISYYGRSYADGKKIRWTDGIRALYCILKYNIFSRK
jgi:glycosyltransferase involved in cell wall biosynthesis